MAPPKHAADGILAKEIQNPVECESEPASDATLKAAHGKVDKRLLYWYAFVFLIMHINVKNITNTAIMNLEQGTGIKRQLGNLSSAQWAWALSIFYYPYMCLEPLATLMLKHWSPKVWMSRIMLTWGIVSMCQGATQNYSGILACRCLLGAAEAGFFPGVLYHLSFWYPTHRLPFRVAFFYACGMFAGTISGLLAYGISFMNGMGGLAGWRWLFILEGVPAILCSVYTLFFLPNYPQTVEFLDEDERAAILADLPKQAPTMQAKTFDLNQVKDLIKTPTFFPFLMIWTTHGIGGWGISFVLPSVIYELGVSSTAISQVMTMPPFTLVFIILCSIAILIHTKHLSPWTAGIGVEIVQIICYILLITVKQPVAKYVFVMIATAASQSFFPIIWPERIRAARGTTTAGLAIGLTNACGQLMGIVGPQIYQSKFGPAYRVSYICSIGILSACLCAVLITWAFVWRDDRQREAEKVMASNTSTPF